MDEKKHIMFFLKETLRRIKELESKNVKTRAEGFELDMCRYDVKMCRKELGL